jgi:hypothetical protein
MGNAVAGSLAPGKFADFIVLDRNPLSIPAEDIAAVRVLRTVVGGNSVYRASGIFLRLCQIGVTNGENESAGSPPWPTRSRTGASTTSRGFRVRWRVHAVAGG